MFKNAYLDINFGLAQPLGSAFASRGWVDHSDENTLNTRVDQSLVTRRGDAEVVAWFQGDHGRPALGLVSCIG